ncbi:MAG: helix-turn-helix domain-containing protein [Caldilineaceae bacterium]
MQLNATPAFGALLKHLRKEAGMTQRDLAAALGYSESLICSLEKAQRLPDLQAVMERFVPALGLQDDPAAATRLIEQAALARGMRVPVTVTVQRTIQTAVQTQSKERIAPLPALPTTLIGREAVVNQLCNRLTGHQGRLLTFVGAPGVGKTTLALAVATRVQAFYADGAIFVPLATINDPALMAVAILLAAGSKDVDSKSPQNELVAFLRRRNMLLVLDNLEQIDGAAALVARVVAECPGIAVLGTSRERLHLRAEQRFKVPPLDRAAALELFVQCAQAVAADFCLTPRNQPTLEAICQRLDYLPLALELCASQIDLLSPVQLLAHLQTRPLDLLVDGAYDLPPRPTHLAHGHPAQLCVIGRRRATPIG